MYIKYYAKPAKRVIIKKIIFVTYWLICVYKQELQLICFQHFISLNLTLNDNGQYSCYSHANRFLFLGDFSKYLATTTAFEKKLHKVEDSNYIDAAFAMYNRALCM